MKGAVGCKVAGLRGSLGSPGSLKKLHSWGSLFWFRVGLGFGVTFRGSLVWLPNSKLGDFQVGS